MSIIDHILPSEVTLERTRNGTHFDPPCPTMDHPRDRLAWALGAAHAETGIKLELMETDAGWALIGPGNPEPVGRDPWAGLHLVLVGIRLGQAL